MINDQLSAKWKRRKASEDKENDKEEEQKGEDKSAHTVFREWQMKQTSVRRL